MVGVQEESVLQGERSLFDRLGLAAEVEKHVAALDADFYVFSGHKVFGPSGAGVLHGKLPMLESMPPFLGGGDMIESVSFDGTTFAPVPQKFEAGTPDIASIIGFGAAIDYLEEIGMAEIAAYEHTLLEYATPRLESVPGLRILGSAKEKAAVLSFVMDCAHPHDVATVLDQQGIAVRAGHHCAQPVMDRFDVPATTRASLSLYNTKAEVDALVALFDSERAFYAERGEDAVLLANAEENAVELAAWTVVGNVLLNLDEVLVKG